MPIDIYLSASADLQHRAYTLSESEARDARQALFEHFGGDIGAYLSRSFRADLEEPQDAAAAVYHLNAWAARPEQMLNRFVVAMRSEVRELMASGRIPGSAKTFSELHDHIDANEIGGFCDDDVSQALLIWFGGDDLDGGWPQSMIDFINEAQGAIDKWLASGMPNT